MSGCWSTLRAARPSRVVVLGLAAAVGGLVAAGPASAQDMPPRYTDTETSSCIYSYGLVSCVQQYRYGDRGSNGIIQVKPPSEAGLAEARERDTHCRSRCQPQLRPDRYGVGRYVYAAPGCEYGR
jgi:hypothetical protein